MSERVSAPPAAETNCDDGLDENCDGRQNGGPSNRFCRGNGMPEGPEGDGRWDDNP